MEKMQIAKAECMCASESETEYKNCFIFIANLKKKPIERRKKKKK